MKKTAILLCMLVLAGISQLVGQSGEQESPGARLSIIRSKASSGDPLLKLEALKWVDRMINENSMGGIESEVVNIVANLGLEPFLSTQRSGISPIIVNDHPLVRREAAVVLGRIGGAGSVRALVDMVHHEEDLDVLKNIMYAFGNIGENPGQRVTEAIGRRIYRVNATGSIDDELAYATLYAIEQISILEGGIEDPSVYDTLAILSDERFANVVTEKALNVIELLWEADNGENRGVQGPMVIPDDPEGRPEDDQSI